jgi:alginate O-acetyltransferase complex protein AlgI
LLFNSLTFSVFLAIVVAMHYAPLSWRMKKINLLIASYIFYGAWSPPFVLLLILSTAVDWKAAQWIHNAKTEGGRRFFLLLSLGANLGILGYFKYGEFLLGNFTALMKAIGIDHAPPEWNVILPVGISFYTFQTMAYSLDVYLRRAAPTKSPLDFALFVTFFPQLVAGPIVRPSQLVPQFAEPKQATRQQFFWGVALIIIGLFEKVVLADSFLAPAADGAFGHEGALAPLDAWTGVLAFSGQIFFDFSGYSTTAIGTALCLGFALPNNFLYPYAAIGFSDFWRRWHISLSTWLRDYLYIPLGGNQKGSVRTYINLMITMLLGGLWHGASWNFVWWGVYHGGWLALERALGIGRDGARRSRALDPLRWAVCFYLTLLGWILFRVGDPAALAYCVRKFVLFDGHLALSNLGLGAVNPFLVALVGAGFAAAHLFSHRVGGVAGWLDRRGRAARVAVYAAAAAVLTLLWPAGETAFIYFQF